MLSQKLISSLKRIPIDLGQGAVAETTMGKQIALGLVPDGYGKRAIDIGCREGNQSRWLKEKGYSVESVDVESTYAEAKIVDMNKGLPFEDDSFDLVWCSEVIEHLIDPLKSYNEMYRVCRKGGQLILTTPNSYAFIFRMIAVFGLTPQKIQRRDHLHFFSEDDVKKLFPGTKIYGYFPYIGKKYKIENKVGLLSPTFVIHAIKK